MKQTDILIVGASPVGLTAAIELARRGHGVRIIDNGTGPVPESRALGINARTLELLEPSGVTAEILNRAIKVRGLKFRDPPKLLFAIDFNNLDHRFNFIAALPQDQTEMILIERLKRLGTEVEWESELVDLKDESGSYAATIQRGGGARTSNCPIVIGCDGAHSFVRHHAGIGFDGEAYPNDWGLADVRLSGPVERDIVNVYRIGGAIFGIIPRGGDGFRVVSDRADVLDLVPPEFTVEETVWTSTFRISHRQVESYQKGNLFLAGDAAHIHSPLGGRGMNLGIEDAAWLAWLIDCGRTGEYTGLRKPVGARVVRQTDAQTRLMVSANPLTRFVRRQILPLLLSFNGLQRRQLREVAGLTSPEPEWLDA